MYVGRDFDPSQTTESELYCFDFSKDLRSGDVVESAVWACTVSANSEVPDEDADTRLEDDAIIQSPRTYQRITGLVPGVTYRLQATVTTRNGDRITLWSNVRCEVAG